MTRYFLGAVLLILIGYGLIEAWPLLEGPALRVDSPRDSTAFPEGIIVVRGNAARTATLTLNGAVLLHDQKGDFSSTLTFPRGGSILTFVALDRFGRTETITRTIFVP